ncbi:helix-turn-helix domain-containing protein [Pseudomonas mosselii]|uniref:helix-turn-helix domain-containing protein n=1 Tax=Pseudomonas mosselii TaxID=78327 RepID=UPI00244B35D2|nr:helix-turn-helix domain-containing protein [Pseudomonas mosselii]MDH1143311.1 helix-turn-helix domain-containing protein [Pseudomonas mosselii]
MTETRSFAERLRWARSEAGLTQKELSEKSGISQPQIVRYEAGRSKPRLGGALKLARALKIDAYYLMPELKQTTTEVEVEFTEDEAAQLHAEATKLGITTEELLRRLIGLDEDDASDDEHETSGREISVTISAENESRIQEFAKSAGVSFDAAVQLILAHGLKERLDDDTSMLAQLEQDVPGAYEKLVELLKRS